MRQKPDPFCDTRDYAKYLGRYADEGEGEPLSEDEFCRLQEELLDLLADRAAGGKLSPEERQRILELRRLLLSDI
ncbi:MAG: hypothetical protein JXA37_07420 [Chloroflexia bacterium]|nr:hypothetical protein [Chloroflexia bacterium]